MSFTDSLGSMIIVSEDADVTAAPARNEPDRLKVTVNWGTNHSTCAYLTEDEARDLGKYLTDWANGHV